MLDLYLRASHGKKNSRITRKNIFVTLWFVPLLYCSDSSLQFFVLYGSSLPIIWNKKKFRNGVHRARNIKKLRHLCPPEIIWTSEMPCGSGLWSIKFSSLPPTVPRGNTVWEGHRSHSDACSSVPSYSFSIHQTKKDGEHSAGLKDLWGKTPKHLLCQNC